MKLYKYILLLALVFVYSCGGGGGTDYPASTRGSGDDDNTGDIAASITLVASPSAATVGASVTISGTVLDSGGDNVSDGTDVSFSATAGTITASGTTTSGTVSVTLDTTGATPGTPIVVTATSGTSPNVVTDTVSVTINADVVASISLAATPTSVVAGSTVSIAATVLDNVGANVPDGTQISFSTTRGTITSSATTTSGIATVTLDTTTATPGTTATVTASSGGGVSNTIDVPVLIAVSSISLTATPASVTIGATVSIEATVLNSGGGNAPDGTSVSFSTTSGTIASTATVSNGIATATLDTAGSLPGTATITVSSSGITETITVTLAAPLTGSIVFDSATPQVIGLRGFGQTETSEIVFIVTDINGDPVLDGIEVDLEMSGPGGGRSPDDGGEYIGTRDDGSPTEETVSTFNGEASVFLHSGTLAGPVTIVATVEIDAGPPAVTISSSSAVISIGGGVPSATHFTISTSLLNLAGYTDRGSFGIVNEQATVSAFAADRFGNYNVLEGTSVSFYTEAGAIDRNGNTGADGSTSVILRTQDPMPEDVAEEAFETTLRTTVNTIWGIDTTTFPYHPRDGWVDVFATTMGEEAFEDANANGIYDAGENFTDLDEPFFDKNDDGCRNDGTQAFCPDGTTPASTDPFEEFIDANNNGVYDIPNGCWDGPFPDPAYSCAGRQDSKMIYDRMTMMFTSRPDNIAIVCDSTDAECDGPYPSNEFTIANGGALNFYIIVGDINFNVPVGGTSITVSVVGGGTLTSFVPSPIADAISSGPVMFTVNLSDGSATDTDPPENAIVAVEVQWKGVSYFATATGTVD